MKKIVLLLLVIVCLSNVKAQVQVRPLPKAGYELRIRNLINNIRVVDTHEHLASPEGYKKSGKLDKQ